MSTRTRNKDSLEKGLVLHQPHLTMDLPYLSCVRYWARSFLGWPSFSRRTPNAAHEGLSRLMDRGWVQGLITQNVDRLHHWGAGDQRGHVTTQRILELHGTTHEVVCMSCGDFTSRQRMQDELSRLNPAAAKLAEVVGTSGE